VLDLCCSVGGDLLALPDGSVGVDLDEARLLLARANAELLGRDVALVRADVTALRLPRGADVVVDPARRAGARRVFDPRAYAPPLDLVLGWRERVRSLVVKVAPGRRPRRAAADVEVEVVSLRGEVKEAVLLAGRRPHRHRRTATLLPGRTCCVDDPVPPPRCARRGVAARARTAPSCGPPGRPARRAGRRLAARRDDRLRGRRREARRRTAGGSRCWRCCRSGSRRCASGCGRTTPGRWW
jgi:hypothetical protein